MSSSEIRDTMAMETEESELDVTDAVGLRENGAEPISQNVAATVIIAEEPALPAAAVNPDIAEDLSADELRQLRGDAIGNTMYTERYILSILMRLKQYDFEKNLKEDESFESELCLLWDMTVEADVVRFLIEKEVYELFVHCICASNDKRFIEILMGIIGNMCILQDGCKVICSQLSTVGQLLNVINSCDSPAIVALLRFITVFLYYADFESKCKLLEVIVMLPNFLQDFSNVMANSTNPDLLYQTLTTLNLIATNYNSFDGQAEEPLLEQFKRIFATEPVFRSTLEAFETFIERAHENRDNDNIIFDRNTQKAVIAFLEIVASQLRFGIFKIPECQTLKSKFFNQLKSILKCICDPMFILPIHKTVVLIVESVEYVFYLLDYPFEKKCFELFVPIWFFVNEEKEKSAAGRQEFEEDGLNGDSDIDYTDFSDLIFNMISATTIHSKEDDLKVAVQQIERRMVAKLLNELKSVTNNEQKRQCWELITKHAQ